MIFSCKYCGGRFCAEHRIPEMHSCDMVKAYEPVTVLRETKKFEFSAKRKPRFHLTPPGVKFTRREFRDLAIAMLLVVLAFLRFNQLMTPSLGSSSSLWTLFFVLTSLSFGACLAFLVHELAHKFMATHLGSSAEFKLDPIGVAVTAISGLAGLPVIVPGAVNISRLETDKETMGKIALIGPLANIMMALIARALLWNDLVFLNVLFAFVNLLPIYILDGKKVWRWSRIVWLAAILASISIVPL
jgi:Zn-dependent protease